MNNAEYNQDLSHIANQIQTAAESIPALKAQLKDSVTLEEIDNALEIYRKVFSAKQWTFCVNLADGMTKRQAMDEAGYQAASAKWANQLLDAHRSGVNNCYNLMLQRKYLSSSVSKRWITGKLVWVVEQAQENQHLKTMIAGLRELSLLAGHHSPVKIDVENRVSVQYEFVNLASGPGIKEIAADIAPEFVEAEFTETKQLSKAAIEFSQYALPS